MSSHSERTWRYIAGSWRTTAEESIEIVSGSQWPSDGELLVPAAELAVATVELNRIRTALREELARADRDYEPSGYIDWLKVVLGDG